MPPVQSDAVIDAIGALKEAGKPTTSVAIAAYLQVPELEVKEELRALRANRIFDCRHKAGKQVWMPWREAVMV